MRRHHIKKGRGAGGIEPLQKVDFIHAQMPAIRRRRQGGHNDHSVGVSGADGRGRRFEQLSIAHGFNVAIAPVRRNVGFIPKLVEAHGCAIPLGDPGGKARKDRRISRRRQWVIGRAPILLRPRPSRAAIQEQHRHKASGHNLGYDGVTGAPVIAFRSRFDLPPIQPLAHPAKASVPQALKGNLPFGG